jgi:hypothetical protein
MYEYELKPLVGVGPVRLGMTRGEVRAALGREATEFVKRGETVSADAFDGNRLQVFYDERDCAEFIELSSGGPHEPRLYGIDVLRRSADEVIRAISAWTPYDPEDDAPHERGYSYTFPSLGLAFWRPVIPESYDDDEPEDEYLHGRVFQSVAIAAPGYFMRPSG